MLTLSPVASLARRFPSFAPVACLDKLPPPDCAGTTPFGAMLGPTVSTPSYGENITPRPNIQLGSAARLS